MDSTSVLIIELADCTSKADLLMSSSANLVNLQKIAIKTMSRTDSKSHIVFEVLGEEPLNLKVQNRYETDDSDISLKVNNALVTFGSHPLKKADRIEIEWKF